MHLFINISTGHIYDCSFRFSNLSFRGLLSWLCSSGFFLYSACSSGLVEVFALETSQVNSNMSPTLPFCGGCNYMIDQQVE